MRIEVAGAKLSEGNGPHLVEEAARLAEEWGVIVQLMDARLVCGKEHLEVAAEKALRAQEQGRMTAKTLAAEILLYASGERQIKTALGKMGVRTDTDAVGIVVGGASIQDAVKALGLVRDDHVLEPTLEKLEAFGIDREAVASIEPDEVAGLVLERVAMVDLLK